MGAMAQLLSSYPELITFLEHQISESPLILRSLPGGKIAVQGLSACFKSSQYPRKFGKQQFFCHV